MAKAAKKAAAKAPKKAATSTAKPPKKAAAEQPKKAAAKAPKKAAAGKTARKANPAFMTPLNVSPALAEVVGDKPLPRTEIIKKIWDYIKQNNLQDSQNKRMINADDKLRPVFEGKDQISMFELAKVVNNQVK